MWQRIREIMRKEFRQTLREPRMRTTLLAPPLLQLIIFGYAVNMDVDSVRIAWMDHDRTPESRELQERFQGSRYFEIVATPVEGVGLQELMDNGRIQGAVSLLPGFGGDVKRGRQTSVQVLVDGTNSNTAAIISSYATQVVGQYSAAVMIHQQNALLVGRTAAAGGPVALGIPQIGVRSRVWFNPDLHSRSYFVPGVIVSIITLVTLMLTAMAIVREKEIGTMEQLLVTPVRPLELMLGKTLPFALVGLADTVLVTAVARLMFHVPLRGNLLVLLLGTCLFLMTTLGAGLFLSAISSTQQQAMMFSFFFFQPAFMLSGFAFPVRNMPEAVQWLTYLNPLRYFMDVVRGIFLKGSGIAVLWPQLAAMAVFGAAILILSALRFSKRLD